MCYTDISSINLKQMKANIHPQYVESTITCSSCSNTFTAASTKSAITVEVCSNCHPFYTGEQRFIDSKGNVDKFLKKQQVAKEYKAKFGDKKDKKVEKDSKQGKSLRELLGEV